MKYLQKSLSILGLFFLSACSLYRRNFDSCPTDGVACTPVTTLEKMIVEATYGDDLFLKTVPTLISLQKPPACLCTEKNESKRAFQRRIWLNSKVNDEHNLPTYLYFDE